MHSYADEVVSCAAQETANVNGNGRLDFYVVSIESVAHGFKDVFCPTLEKDDREVCVKTPIRVLRSWGIGAFASLEDHQPVISITAGTGEMLDAWTWARTLSGLITGNDACFRLFTKNYAGVVGENQRRLSTGSPLCKSEHIGVFAANHADVCAGFDDQRINNLMTKSLREDHAREVEAGLTFILLHELAHVIRRDVLKSIASSDERQQVELAADTWAIDTAMSAGYYLGDSITPEWLTVLQKQPSIDWEHNSGHPLGARRAVNFFKTVRANLNRNVHLRETMERDGTLQDNLDELDRNIELATKCVQAVDQDKNEDGCS